MDKLITTSNGGIPFVNDDHRWSDESIRDFINNQLSDFAITIGTNGNFYLSGAGITYNPPTSEYTIDDGYVYINGEILKVDTGIYNRVIAPSEYRIIVVETYDTTGDKTTRSGSSLSTYRKRRAVPTVHAIADAWTDDMLEFVLSPYQERLQEKIDKLLGAVSYTEQNYITDGEKVTDSVDALDVKLKDVSDKADKLKSLHSNTKLVSTIDNTSNTSIVEVTATSTLNYKVDWTVNVCNADNNGSLEIRIYKNSTLVETYNETILGGATEYELLSANYYIGVLNQGDVVKITGKTTIATTLTISRASLSLTSID